MTKIYINTKNGFVLREVKDTDKYNIVGKQGRYFVGIKKRVLRKRRLPTRKVVRGRKAIKDIAVKKRIGGKELKIRKARVLRGSEKIEKIFDKKVTKVVIKDLLNIPTSEINLQYRPLLKSAMSSKGLGDLASDDVLNAMIKQENINKIKWRFEIRADVYDRDRTRVCQMIKGSGGDLMTLKEAMKKGVWRGAKIDYDIDLGEGYIFKLINKGNVDRVEATIVFRG